MAKVIHSLIRPDIVCVSLILKFTLKYDVKNALSKMFTTCLHVSLMLLKVTNHIHYTEDNLITSSRHM